MMGDSSLGWIILAAVVYFGIGAVWYSPLLFMKPWQAEIKKKQVESTMATPAMAVTAAAILVLVMVESYVIQAFGINGLSEAFKVGVLLWFGFVATTSLVNNVFQNGSKKLYAIDQGYHLVGMIVAALILTH